MGVKRDLASDGTTTLVLESFLGNTYRLEVTDKVKDIQVEMQFLHEQDIIQLVSAALSATGRNNLAQTVINDYYLRR